MASVSSTNWHVLGKVSYEKRKIYDMAWFTDTFDLSDFRVCCSPFAGPLALFPTSAYLRHTKKSPYLLLYTSAGKLLCEIPMPKSACIALGWTSEMRICLVFQDGSCHSYSPTGERLNKFAMLPAKSSDRIVLAQIWEDGIVGLSEKLVFVHVSEIDSARPNISLLADANLKERTTAPTCISILEPKFTKTSSPDVLVGTKEGSIILVTKTSVLDLNLYDKLSKSSKKRSVLKMSIAPNGMFMGIYTEDGTLTVLNTSFDKKILAFDTKRSSSSRGGSSGTPHQMVWCGEDALVLYWKREELVMIGPFGSWVSFDSIAHASMAEEEDDLEIENQNPEKTTTKQQTLRLGHHHRQHQKSRRYCDEMLFIMTEPDACRIYGSRCHELLRRVPSATETLRRMGSTAPGALLVDARDTYDQGDARSDELLRQLESDGQLKDAVEQCTEAALEDFEFQWQRKFLRAASYGRTFSFARKEESGGDLDNEDLENGGAVDPEAFVEKCRHLRVLNALRHRDIGLPLTRQEYDRLKPKVVLARLVAMHHHFVALKICNYLAINPDRVLIHWAIEKVKHAPVLPHDHQSNESKPDMLLNQGEALLKKLGDSTSSHTAHLNSSLNQLINQPLLNLGSTGQAQGHPNNSSSQNPKAMGQDEQLVELIRQKLGCVTHVSYAEIAHAAEKVGRRRLATMLLDLEDMPADQVPLLLSMGEFELALRKAVESADTDLIYMVCLHMERTLKSKEKIKYVLSREDSYREAIVLMVTFYRETKSSTNRHELLLRDAEDLPTVDLGDHYVRQAYHSTGSWEERSEKLKLALATYTEAKAMAHAKAVEEQIELIAEQMKLSDRTKLKLLGKSVSETVECLVMEAQKRDARMLQYAKGVAQKFKLPDKCFYRVKINALARTQQWDVLMKFSNEKKTPPCGFKPFALACFDQGETREAEKYVLRITNDEEKFDTFKYMELWQPALEVAVKLKDPEKLSAVRNGTTNADIHALVDQAAVKLGFV